MGKIENDTGYFNTFLKWEEEYALFDLKTEDGIYVWDLFRLDVSLLSLFTTPLPKSKKGRPLKYYVKGGYIYLISFFSFLFKKRDNILFSASRNRTPEGFQIDIVSANLIDELSPDLLIVERKRALNRYPYPIEYNFINTVKKLIPVRRKLPLEIYDRINTAYREAFGRSDLSYQMLNGLFISFLKQYKYYRFYFKYKRPKRIFFIQDGIQKGLLCAAKSLGIPTVELQHGSILKGHFSYSYPDIISNGERVILPDFLWTFSAFWSNSIHIPTTVVPIGNDLFVKDKVMGVCDRSILVISSIMHGEELSQIVVLFARKYPEIPINYKLHPNEYRKEECYAELFNDYRNVHIIKNEVDIGVLISRSELVVLINSTVLYEALQLGHKIAIHKSVNYMTQENAFGLPNVYLFETVEELWSVYNSEKADHKAICFEKFNRSLFVQLLQKMANRA